MRKSSILIALIVLIIAILWVMSGVVSKPQEQNNTLENKTSDTKKQSVLVETFTQQNFQKSVTINGRSQASRSVTIKAEISAQVKEIIKEKGSKVAAGDTVLRLKQDDRALRVKELTQRLRQKQIEYNAAIKLKKEGFNSNVRVAEALAEREAAKASLERAKLDLKNTEISVPFDGIIDRQHVEIGDFLSVGQDILKIVDLDPIEFEVFLSEKDINGVTLNSNATVTLTNGENLEGTISYIAVSADEKTRTFPVEISVPNPQKTLKEGVTVELNIPLQAVLAHKVPSSSIVLNDNGDIGVRTVTTDNTVLFLPVKILSSNGAINWVSGLPDTVNIITQGQQFVINDQRITPTFKTDMKDTK